MLLFVKVAVQLSFSGMQRLEKTIPSPSTESVMFMSLWLLRTPTGSTLASKPSIVGQYVLARDFRVEDTRPRLKSKGWLPLGRFL